MVSLGLTRTKYRTHTSNTRSRLSSRTRLYQCSSRGVPFFWYWCGKPISSTHTSVWSHKYVHIPTPLPLQLPPPFHPLPKTRWKYKRRTVTTLSKHREGETEHPSSLVWPTRVCGEASQGVQRNDYYTYKSGVERFADPRWLFEPYSRSVSDLVLQFTLDLKPPVVLLRTSLQWYKGGEDGLPL